MKQFLKKNLRFLYDYLAHIKYFIRFKKLIIRFEELEPFLNKAPVKNNETVLFNMTRTYVLIQLFIELLLALKLKNRGYKVVVMYDDGILNHHETLTKADKKSYSTYYPIRIKVILYLLKKVPFINKILYPYSKLNISVEDIQVNNLIKNNFIYDDINFFEYIEASLVRFFLSAPDSKILKQEKDYDKALKFFTRNALLSYELAKNSIEKLSPDIMITSHGIYTTWGIFMQKYRRSEIRVITYGGNGYVTNGLDFGINDISANKIDNGFFEYFLEKTSNSKKDEYLKIVDTMMENRFSGKSSDTGKIKNFVGNEINANINKIISLKNTKKVFAIFPNVMWDNATTFKEWNTIFESPIEWLVETVKYFLNSDDKVLVIRVHPAEYLWMEVRISIQNILEIYFDKEIFNHKNIIFIPPNEKVMSYDLFPLLDGAIVYNGTIGLELMYKDVPLITGARTAYSNKGFTKDIINKDEYFNIFNNTKEILTIQTNNKNLLKLFIYEYFFLHGVPLKILSNKNLLKPNFEDDIEEIWNDKNLEYILDVIEGKRKYFQEWENR